MQCHWGHQKRLRWFRYEETIRNIFKHTEAVYGCLVLQLLHIESSAQLQLHLSKQCPGPGAPSNFGLLHALVHNVVDSIPGECTNDANWAIGNLEIVTWHKLKKPSEWRTDHLFRLFQSKDALGHVTEVSGEKWCSSNSNRCRKVNSGPWQIAVEESSDSNKGFSALRTVPWHMLSLSAPWKHWFVDSNYLLHEPVGIH
jgi:hypothetical protein